MLRDYVGPTTWVHPSVVNAKRVTETAKRNNTKIANAKNNKIESVYIGLPTCLRR